MVPHPAGRVLVLVGTVGMRLRGGRPWACQAVRTCWGSAGWWVRGWVYHRFLPVAAAVAGSSWAVVRWLSQVRYSVA